MYYFDGIKELSNTLVEESTGLLDTTKEFRQKLADSKYELEQDFNDEEIEDNLGDDDFLNDYAEQLEELMQNLSDECDRVMADCKARKARLDHAITWDEEEEEITQLSSNEANLMNKFYELANGCENWYDDASKKFAADAESFEPYITEMGDAKYLLMQYARSDFQNMKDKFFTIVDGLRDSQRVLQSTQEYFAGKSLKMMKKKIDDPKYKFQLKYSTKMIKRCEHDAPEIQKFEDDQIESINSIAKAMTNAKVEFAKNASQDYVDWNCKEMYPRPKKTEIKQSSWLGGITDIAKKAFGIYNEIKPYIPGGTKAGAGPVPGSEDIETKDSLISLVGFKEVAGEGMKIVEKLAKEPEEDEERFKERLAVWQNALSMCEDDK